MKETVKRRAKSRVLWAVDAFPDDPKIQRQAIAAARPFLQAMQVTIEPVYVAKPGLPGIMVQVPEGLDAVAAQVAKSHVKKYVREARLSSVLPPRFIFAHAPSTSAMVKDLVEYAKEQQAELILVATHGRKGVSRFFMGSFAEQLVLRSPIPVMVTRAGLTKEKSRSIKHIIFPTDFSVVSQRVFAKALSLAKELKADLLLFHQMEFVYPEIALPFTTPPMPPIDFSLIAQSRRAEAELWIEQAQKVGVRAKFHLATKLSDAVTGILHVAKKLPGSLICMASQSGQMETLFLGSVARRVLRTAPCPVYLIHPEEAKTTETATAKQKEPLTQGKAILA